MFTIIFALEMVLKLLGLGLKDYVKDGFNIFDAVIVVFSLFELMGDSDGGNFTVLRGFRLLRIFKIVRSWTSLRKLLQTVIASFPAIANLGLLTFLFLFIYALVGKQFFAGEFLDDDGQPARYSFNTIESALVTMFIVLTGENWNEIMRLIESNVGYIAIPFFVSAIVIGNFMLLNLFLAILLKFIEEKHDDEEETLATNQNADNPIIDQNQPSDSDLNEEEIMKVLKAT